MKASLWHNYTGIYLHAFSQSEFFPHMLYQRPRVVSKIAGLTQCFTFLPYSHHPIVKELTINLRLNSKVKTCCTVVFSELTL